MGDMEAVGDIVTGGMIGRAVEPRAGEDDGHTHETSCLNCGTPLAGPFCHECGQHAHVHRTLSAFFHDFLHGVLHFEGKIWRTLPLLAWKPGELTRRYIDGERASFVSPIALFLFTVFMTFAIMGLTGSLDTALGEGAQNGLKSEMQDAQVKVTKLQAERAQAIREKRSTTKIDEKLREARSELAIVNSIKTGPAGLKDAPVSFDADTPGWLRDSVDKAAKNPELVFYKLKNNAYKFSWALIPISVPFVWLLFPFSRRFRMYDHTVFVTYSITFMMLLMVAGTLLMFVAPFLAALCWFIPPIHMYRQLRGTYGVSPWGAVWRTTALTMFAFLAIGLFFALLAGVEAAG